MTRLPHIEPGTADASTEEPFATPAARSAARRAKLCLAGRTEETLESLTSQNRAAGGLSAACLRDLE